MFAPEPVKIGKTYLERSKNAKIGGEDYQNFLQRVKKADINSPENDLRQYLHGPNGAVQFPFDLARELPLKNMPLCEDSSCYFKQARLCKKEIFERL